MLHPLKLIDGRFSLSPTIAATTMFPLSFTFVFRRASDLQRYEALPPTFGVPPSETHRPKSSSYSLNTPPTGIHSRNAEHCF